MYFVSFRLEEKAPVKGFSQGLCIISLNTETTAFFRAVQAKGPKYDKPLRCHGSFRKYNICCSLFRFDQKMEDGAIMPDIIGWKVRR